MRGQIITLRLHRQLIDIAQYRIHVIFQRVQSVLEVMIMILLFRSLIIGLAGHVECIGRIGIIVLKHFVEEYIPHLGRNLARLGLN